MSAAGEAASWAARFTSAPGGSLTVENAQLDGFISSEGGFGGEGAPATAGAVQGDGGNGAAAGVAEGGAIYNAGTVTLESARIANSDADSSGGDGGNCCVNGYGGSQLGKGGASGGNGAPAAQTLGGAIYNSGMLHLEDVDLDFNSVTSRGGGGGSTSYAGTPGAGADGAVAEGGAIYTTTSLPDACATFGSNTVTGQGGPGGVNYSQSTHGTSGTSPPALGPNISPGATVHACQIQVDVSDAFVREPAKGRTVDAKFTVSLNDKPRSPITVHYETKDGSATVAHGDYKRTAGVLTFDTGGATEQSVPVPVHGSGLVKEARFSLVLTKPTGATVDRSVGVGTIESDRIEITTKTLPHGDPGRSYSATLHGQGGAPPYLWTLSAGALPLGLSLDPLTGVISGTPDQEGKSTFTVEAGDSADPQNTAHAQLTITVGLHINSISPDDSSPQGGAMISVTGYGFEAAPDKLAFCPTGQTSECVAAEDVSVISDTSLTAVIPAESDPIKAAGGEASVAVDQGGTGHSNLVPFVYGLHISSISPAGSSKDGGGTITVTGNGFKPRNSVVLCPQGQTTHCIEASNVDVKASTSLTAEIPGETDWIQQAGGQASVTVFLNPTTHSNLVTFTYGMHVDSISPTSSPASGGSTITVTGYGFEGAPDTLAFCPSGQTSQCVAADNLDVASDTLLTATIPAESGPITSAGGRASVAVDQGGTTHSNLVPFTYAGRVRSDGTVAYDAATR